MNSSRREKVLKPNQRIALLALASGERPRHVAARAGVSVATLYRWRRGDRAGGVRALTREWVAGGSASPGLRRGAVNSFARFRGCGR